MKSEILKNYNIATDKIIIAENGSKSIFFGPKNDFKKQCIKKHKLPVKIAFTFIRGTRHKFDYINPAQTVQDDMVKNEWIEDDNMEFIIPVFKKYRYNKEKPGVIIEIINESSNRI